VIAKADTVVQNFLHVPLQLEECLLFGLAVCVDAFLYAVTVLPLRVLVSVGALIKPGYVRREGGREGFFSLSKQTRWCKMSYVSLFNWRSVCSLAWLCVWMPSCMQSRCCRCGCLFLWGRCCSHGKLGRGWEGGGFPMRHILLLLDQVLTYIPLSLSLSLPPALPPLSHRRAFHRHNAYDLMRGLTLLITCIVLQTFQISRVYHYIRGQVGREGGREGGRGE